MRKCLSYIPYTGNKSYKSIGGFGVPILTDGLFGRWGMFDVRDTGHELHI